MTRKSLILLLAIVVLIVGSAFAVMAQDESNNPTSSCPGWMHHGDNEDFGMGMMHRHGMMWSDGEPMMVSVAEALGLEPDVFFAALRDGQTLAEIAEAQGVELEVVYDAILSYAEDHMTQLVEAGTITQEQADAHLAWMRENIAEMPMFAGGGFGGCMGGEFGSGMGMMRHGHHR